MVITQNGGKFNKTIQKSIYRVYQTGLDDYNSRSQRFRVKDDSAVSVQFPL